MDIYCNGEFPIVLGRIALIGASAGQGLPSCLERGGEGEREREREEEDDESWAALDFFYFLSGVFLFFYFVLEREKNKPLDLWTGYSYPLSRNTSLPELRR